jgi:signal peptide peptidase SppA
MSEKQPPRRVLRLVREQPWAILPSALLQIAEVVELRAAGIHLSKEEISARLEAASRPSSTAAAPGSIAVLNVFGPLAQRMDLFTEVSGGTSYEGFASAFRQVLDEPNVTGILLNVDSPGGSVSLLQETADLIYSARGVKPVVASVNTLAASAAYWLASQAEEVIITPSGEVGSIGVITMHEDDSKADEMEGYAFTYISAPEGGYKSEGNPHEPLGDEARACIQGRVNEVYESFVAAVARGRGIKANVVKSDFGKGRLVGAKTAVALGMADRIGTLQDAADRLIKKRGKSGARAEGGELPIEAAAGDELAADPPLIEGPVVSAAAAARARLALARARRSA